MPNRFLGREIGKYKVIRLLGGGAFSWVYEAIDQDLEIPVALKILRPEFAGLADEEARFRREASTAARLRHPNIVNVRDVGRTGDASFVAMDLFPLSLARRLDVLSRLPEPEAIRLGLDIAAALAVAHAGGIVHRDIKPDNILIGTAGEAVVADFGLAHAFAQNTPLSAPSQVTGTPHYFSPEQAQGHDLDGRSDLYSLGVTLYRAATGELPFPGDDWSAVARMHVVAPIPSARQAVEDISPEFDAVLTRLLAKNPAERFSSAVQLADALAALPSAPYARTPVAGHLRAAETVSALPPIQRPPMTTTKSRRRRAVLSVVVATVVAVAGWIGWRSPLVRSFIAPATASGVDSMSKLSEADSAGLFSPLAAGAEPMRLDSALTDSLARAAAAQTPDARATVVSRRAFLTLAAPDSALLYVDNVRIGQGTAVVERSVATTLSLRAEIADAPSECTSARQDSVVRVVPGKSVRVALSVRPCFGLRIAVTPVDATLQFKPLDGGEMIILKSEKATTSILLPEGHYELEISAPRCIRYAGDTIDATRRNSKPLTRQVTLPCT